MKKLLKRWLAAPPRLPPAQATRLAAWQDISPAVLSTPCVQARYVVVDVETTGLNLMTDTLISIGAVAVVGGRISLADSFSVVLQQDRVSRRENILIHGITGTVQREGMPPADALLDFLDYLGKSPLVAFHAALDEAMIQRAMRQYLGLSFKHPWLDLAYLMPALYPALARRHRVLDDWTGRFNIRNAARHDALADAMVTAQLLQVALAQARFKQATDFSALRDLEKSAALGAPHVSCL